ncbi:MAG: membrane protein insertion efficiency factor YidD [Acidobacteria bacterium]|nr:membrane protein insertion efficiency factor YidD [Acidobacteriota bacterium]
MALKTSVAAVFLALLTFSVLMVAVFPAQVQGAEITLLGCYRQVGSPIMQYFVRCRFQPSCAVYALEKLKTENFWKAHLEIVRRLARCSPAGILL